MTKNNLLFVCCHLLSPWATQAGHKTAFYNLKKLSIDHRIDLLLILRKKDSSPNEGELLELKSIVNSLHIVRVSYLDRIFAFLIGFILGYSPQFSTRISFAAIRKIREILCLNSYKYVWAEFSQSFWVARFIPTDANLTLSSHDLQFLLISTKSSYLSVPLLGLTYLCEKNFFLRANHIIVQSMNDKFFIESCYKISNCYVDIISPKISDFILNVRRTIDSIEPYSILFWGAMSRPENYNAAIRFIKSEFNKIIEKYPQAKLYIVGSNPPQQLKRLSSPSIIITGYVEDPEIYFNRASVGIAPLLEGAGIKVKVLEMLKVGLYVISTPVGAESIPRNDNLEVSDFDKFNSRIQSYWINKYEPV